MNDSQLSIEQLKSYLFGSANFLRNKIDAGDYKGYIFPLMFYKRICDVYDEEYQKALSESNKDEDYATSDVVHQFKIPKGCHWNDLRKISKNVGQTLLKSMREIEKANPKTLFGIFGDENWGNKDRLSDETLVNLIEHFSSLNLSTTNAPDDLMGAGYEYLIKKFADDSGHTAAEFYTNRTVVSLMTQLLDPYPNETVYDPTCGTGGMLLECINFLKRNKKDFRTLKLFGQEKNMITSGIARMNMLLHGLEDAQIKRGDTLGEPLFLEEDQLKKFNVILANPPYSINRWNQRKWTKDPFDRNIYGTPPQKKADFAFIQHIVTSMNENGRSAILLPHGILASNSESDIRKNLILDDKLESIIGLAPDLFYNSPMRSCLMIFRKNKSKTKKNFVLFIDAENEFERIGNKNFLSDSNISNIFQIYQKFKNIKGISQVVHKDDILKNNSLLNISLYVKKQTKKSVSEKEAVSSWIKDSTKMSKTIPILIQHTEEILNVR